MKCLIIDDEEIARNYLTLLCEKYDRLELVGTCKNAAEAETYLKSEAVDLLFLDVEMPGPSGLEFLSQLPIKPYVILTTGNTEYAYEAFELEVEDFLKKPFSPERFNKAIQKVFDRMDQALSEESTPESCFIKENGKLVKINFDDILFVENVGDYVRIIINDNKSYITLGTIKGFIEKLPKKDFVKIHRSYIINLTKVKDFQHNTVVINKKVLPVSRSHKKQLLEKMNLI